MKYVTVTWDSLEPFPVPVQGGFFQYFIILEFFSAQPKLQFETFFFFFFFVIPKNLQWIEKCKLVTILMIFFFCRYLPPEIGCLEKLEDLDLSFNKLKSLPDHVAALSALKSLKVSNNKLIELPSGLSCLQSLENLDLSNNRLTSLRSLKLDSMPTLQNLNLQVLFDTWVLSTFYFNFFFPLDVAISFLQ